MTLSIRNYIAEGYDISRYVRGYYPRERLGLQEFDVNRAKWCQQASQVTAFVGICKNLERLTTLSSEMMVDRLKDVQDLSTKVSEVEDTSLWCTQELGTLDRALAEDFSFAHNRRKMRPVPFKTEHALFTPDTMPVGYKRQLDVCAELPCLELLDDDKLNDEDLVDVGLATYREKYSNPYGIYRAWLLEEQAKLQRRAEKKKTALLAKQKTKVEHRTLVKNVKKVELARNKYSFVGKRSGDGGGGGGDLDDDIDIGDDVDLGITNAGDIDFDESDEEEGETGGEVSTADGPSTDASLLLGSGGGEAPGGNDSPMDDNGLLLAPPPPGGLAAPPKKKRSIQRSTPKPKHERRTPTPAVADIFSSIRKGAFNLRKVDRTALPEKKLSERDILLKSIRDYDHAALQDSKLRVLKPKPEAKKRAPLNVGEILQQQLQFMQQVGADIDCDDLDDDDWDDEDDDW